MKYLLLVSVLLCGCLQTPTTIKEKPKPLVKKVVPVTPVTPTPIRSMDVEVDNSIVAQVYRYLGAHNTYSIKEQQVITQAGTTITLPAGTSFTYSLTEKGGTIVFNEPKPVVTAWGMHPVLDQIVLTTPNKGVAHVTEHTGIGLNIPSTKDFVLDWKDKAQLVEIVQAYEPRPVTPTLIEIPSESPKPVRSEIYPLPLPVLYAFGDRKTCEPCRISQDDLINYVKTHKLPCEIIWNPPGVTPPKDVGTPYYLWHYQEDRPSLDVNCPCNWSLSGWYGIDHLLLQFIKTRGTKPPVPEPKKVNSTGTGPTWVAGMHSHKCPRCGHIWSHNGGPGSSHNCPNILSNGNRCNTYQNLIYQGG